jgi:dTDP-4-dehydrorhamnose reductase
MPNRAVASPRVFLVTGGTGQLGYELVRELSPMGSVVSPTRAELDLSHPDSIRAAVARLKPDVIVNAGAYTAVDRAETDRANCFNVNADAPEILACEARRIGAALVHYSTDYVFDGTKRTPYVETDIPAPINVYGESKLAGERAVLAAGGPSIVLRTSWIYGSRGHNFLRTVLSKSREQRELKVVDDQVGAPTWSRAIAAATAQLLASMVQDDALAEQLDAARGVYHLSASGQTSWYGFAAAIVALDRRPRDGGDVSVIPIPSDAYATAAKRPRWSVLDCDRLRQRFGLHLPSWDAQLKLVMA